MGKEDDHEMRARRHTPEQVLRKLRAAERLKADGLTNAEITKIFTSPRPS